MADPTQQPAPKQHPGERLANYFDNFFKTIVATSTLGSSITFAKIVQTPVTPWIDYGYSTTSVHLPLHILAMLRPEFGYHLLCRIGIEFMASASCEIFRDK